MGKRHKLARTRRADFLLKHLDLETATTVEGAVHNSMALDLWNTPDDVAVRIDNKCRQGGWSFAASADAVAACCIQPNTNAVFVSYNLDESTEKIVYAKRIIEALRPSVRPRIVKSNQTGLELANGSRIRSLPCKPPRGKGQPRVYLDEFAFYGNEDKTIYGAAYFALGRGGVLRIGSTPFPAGMFRELADPAYIENRAREGQPATVAQWPWWTFPHLCKPERMKSAGLNAPEMTTEQRVLEYGTDKLKRDYYNALDTLGLSWFQQETECAFITSSATLISKRLVDIAVEDYPLGERTTDPGASYIIGADFAAVQDRTAYTVVELSKGIARVIDIVRIKGGEADEQGDVLRSLIEQYRPSEVLGDQTDGWGRAVIGYVKRWHPFIKGYDMKSGEKQDVVAASTVSWFNNQAVRLPSSDKEIADDCMSVSKVARDGGGYKYVSPRTAKGHADSFWALALALHAAPAPRTPSRHQYTSVIRRTDDWTGGPSSSPLVEFTPAAEDAMDEFEGALASRNNRFGSF